MRSRRPQATAAALLTSAALWAGIASATAVYARSSAFVLGAGLLLATAVAIVGMVAGAARWALRLAIGLAAAMLAFGVVFPLTGWTVAAMATAGLAIVGLAGTGFSGLIRQRPPADGPPRRAVLLSLLLLVGPTVWALVSPDGLAASVLVAGAATWITLLWYTRTAPGALLAVRYALPAVLVVAVVTSEPVTGAAVGLTLVAAVVLAWSREARVAVHPLAEPGTTVPIPPELAPRDVLDAAGIDDRGHRRDGSS